MPNDDDGLTDLLQTPKRTESRSGESDPDPVLVFLFALVALLIAVGFLFAAVRGRPVGTPIVAMVGYTLLFALIAFKFRVSWDRLTRGRFLLQHCLALAIVYAITTGAVAAYPHLPTWFTAVPRYGKKVSLFDLCLILIFLGLAVCEYSWGLRDEGEGITVSWRMKGIRK